MTTTYSVMQTQINMGWFIETLSELEKDLERLNREHLITAQELEELLKLGWENACKQNHPRLHLLSQ